MPKLNDEVKAKREAIQLKIKEMNQKGMFPKGYGKLVLERTNKILELAGRKTLSLNRINQVAIGIAYNETVIEVLLEIAQENKLETQLERATNLLK